MTEALRSTSITEVSSLLWLHPTSGVARYRLTLFPRISHVPFQSLCQVHAACITVCVQPVNRLPPYLSQPHSEKMVLHHNWRFRYFISSSLAFISLTRTCLFTKAFLCPFTTIPLRFQQRRVVWQPRLYNVARVPKVFTFFSIFERTCMAQTNYTN